MSHLLPGLSEVLVSRTPPGCPEGTLCEPPLLSIRFMSPFTRRTFPPFSGAPIKALIETPPLGCLHPLHPDDYFKSPAEYMKWYASNGPLRGTDAPIVGVLLYRKHVITELPYIAQVCPFTKLLNFDCSCDSSATCNSWIYVASPPDTCLVWRSIVLCCLVLPMHQPN